MPPTRTVIWFSAAVAIAYAVWMIRSGVRLAVDTPTYSNWADILIGLNFNVFAYLNQQDFVAPPLFYLAWITVVALMKIAFGASWTTAIVVLNWIAFCAGTYAMFESVRHTTRSGASLLLSAMLLLVAGDLLTFVPFVLSDVMFWALSTAALGCGCALALSDSSGVPAIGTIATGTVLVVVAAMFRPVAIPLIVFWLLALCAVPARHLVDRFATAILVLGLAVATVVMVLHAYVLLNPSAWPGGALPAVLAMVGAEYRSGMFVHQSSPPMLVEPAIDLLGFLRVTLQKLTFFFTPWLPHYSVAHTIVNLLFFLPVYAFSVAAVSNIGRLPPPQRRAVVVLALFVLSTAMFHAMLLVDSDHRYRLPMLSALIMLAAIGLESVRRPRTLASISRAK